ncbi:MAG: PEGA domain-containing protein [Vicinamibacterales bacterium]
MNRTVVAIGGAILVLGGAYLFLNREAPEAPAPTPEAVAPVAAPRAKDAPAPAGESAAPRAATRPKTDAPAPIAEPAPAPVEAAPETGTLRIDADVPGAQVFIDRQYVGTTPATASNIKPGNHQLNVSVEGYDGIVQTIDVEPGPRDITLRFKEVRLDLKIAVVHKHRMGSCQGRLLATPQGIRYETTSKDDAFSASMQDLETFQIDYLEKNLKVKLRKGKQFNFTDPEGNADRLFVFHRDVEKARERLKNGAAPAQ